MKASITVEITGEPIRLSDGTFVTPTVAKRYTMESPTEFIAFRNQYYHNMCDSTYPISQAAFDGLQPESERLVKEGEAAIAKKKAEEEKAKAEAEKAKLEAEQKAQGKNEQQKQPAVPQA